MHSFQLLLISSFQLIVFFLLFFLSDSNLQASSLHLYQHFPLVQVIN